MKQALDSQPQKVLGQEVTPLSMSAVILVLGSLGSSKGHLYGDRKFRSLLASVPHQSSS